MLVKGAIGSVKYLLLKIYADDVAVRAANLHTLPIKYECFTYLSTYTTT